MKIFDWIKSLFQTETEDEKLLRERPDLWYRDRSTKLWLEALTPPRIEYDHSRKIVVNSPVFKVPVIQIIQEREPVASTSKVISNEPANADLFELNSNKELLWRPVKFKRQKHYPDVVPEGCWFQEHSGGFSLMQRDPARYLGHYKKIVIKQLEKEYGKKKARSRKKN
jgi:hypothetical protein